MDSSEYSFIYSASTHKKVKMKDTLDRHNEYTLINNACKEWIYVLVKFW